MKLSDYFLGREYLEVGISMSSECNLRCTYCFTDGGRTPIKVMTPAVMDGIIHSIRKIISHPRCKKLKLQFYAQGEPLLRLKEITYILDGIDAKSFPIIFETRLGTNGTLINEENLPTLLKYFTFLSVSFDGLPEVHSEQRPFANGQGSGDQVAQAVRLLLEHKANFTIRGTISKGYESKILEMGEWLEALVEEYPDYPRKLPVTLAPSIVSDPELRPDFDLIIDQTLSYMKLANRTYPTLLSRITRDKKGTKIFGCGAMSLPGIFILPDGKIITCPRFNIQSEHLDKFTYGYFDQELGDFFVDEDKMIFIRELSLLEKCFPECASCKHLETCSEKCVAEKYEIPDSNSSCSFFKTFYDKVEALGGKQEVLSWLDEKQARKLRAQQVERFKTALTY